MGPERFHPDSEKYVDTPDARICEFVHEPFHECHCMSICSANIPKIIAVCGDQFRSCPIYRRKMREIAKPESVA